MHRHAHREVVSGTHRRREGHLSVSRLSCYCLPRDAFARTLSDTRAVLSIYHSCSLQKLQHFLTILRISYVLFFASSIHYLTPPFKSSVAHQLYFIQCVLYSTPTVQHIFLCSRYMYPVNFHSLL